MSIDPHGPGHQGFREEAEEHALVCANCGTDRTLRLHSISALNPPSDVLVEVGYVCRACNLQYYQQADVVAVAALLQQTPYRGDVLAFAGDYIHCGQPMQPLGSHNGWLSAAAYTDRDQEDPVNVSMETQILRCACGFQIEVPE
jgi:hypothetical protein